MNPEPERCPIPANPEPPVAPAAAPPLLIDIKALAALLSRSVSSLERDEVAGRLPPPVRVGASKRWRRADVDAWVAAGCPAGGREGVGRG